MRPSGPSSRPRPPALTSRRAYSGSRVREALPFAPGLLIVMQAYGLYRYRPQSAEDPASVMLVRQRERVTRPLLDDQAVSTSFRV